MWERGEFVFVYACGFDLELASVNLFEGLLRGCNIHVLISSMVCNQRLCFLLQLVAPKVNAVPFNSYKAGPVTTCLIRQHCTAASVLGC